MISLHLPGTWLFPAAPASRREQTWAPPVCRGGAERGLSRFVPQRDMGQICELSDFQLNDWVCFCPGVEKKKKILPGRLTPAVVPSGSSRLVFSLSPVQTNLCVSKIPYPRSNAGGGMPRGWRRGDAARPRGPGRPPPLRVRLSDLAFAWKKPHQVRSRVFFRRLRLRIGFPTAAGAGLVLSHVS